MIDRVKDAAGIAALILSCGCYSLAQVGLPEELRTDGGRSVLIRTWIDSEPPVFTSPRIPLADAAFGLLLYPVDVVLSAGCAWHAVTDESFDIRGGPIGALAGIALPWVTLVPDLFPPTISVHRVTDAELDALVARIRAGDGRDAYNEVIACHHWLGGAEALISVELDERRSAPSERRFGEERDRDR